MSPRAPRTRAGFTLAEVLIALVIFALLAAAGTAVLAMSIDNRFAVKAASDRTADLQRVRALLKADVGQAIDRRGRGPDGRRLETPLPSGDGATAPLLTLTRTGWANPGGRPRPSLQRVQWRLVEGRLERRVFDQLDGGAPGPAQVLFEGVEAASVGFVTLGVETPAFVPTPQRPMPDAVRVRLTLEGYGPVELLLLVGAGR